MKKQEIITGLTRLLGEAKKANECSPYQGGFDKDVEVLEAAIEKIDKCVSVLAPKNCECSELVYPTGTGE